MLFGFDCLYGSAVFFDPFGEEVGDFSDLGLMPGCDISVTSFAEPLCDPLSHFLPPG